MKTALWVIGSVVAFFVLWAVLFGISILGIKTGGILKAAQVEVDRKVFEQSIPYQRGQRDEFERLKFQWETTKNPAVCSALQSKFRADRTGLRQEQIDYLNRLTC